MWQQINGNKTYILCAAVILGAWASVALGTSDTSHAMDVTEAALGAICMRHGIAKGPTDPTPPKT